jgi:hypothetical protein
VSTRESGEMGRKGWSEKVKEVENKGIWLRK